MEITKDAVAKLTKIFFWIFVFFVADVLLGIFRN